MLRATLIEASSACRGWKKQTKQTYLVCIRRSFLSVRPVFPPSGGDNGVKIRSVCSIINTMAQDDCTQTDPQLSSLQTAATHKQTQGSHFEREEVLPRHGKNKKKKTSRGKCRPLVPRTGSRNPLSLCEKRINGLRLAGDSTIAIKYAN